MKVQDIRSFFKQPKATSSAAPTTPEVIQVPSKLRRGSKKDRDKKGDSQSHSEAEDVKVESEDEDRSEKRSRKHKKDEKKASSSKRKSKHLKDESDDEEEPVSKPPKEEKSKQQKKLKVLSDSDEDFDQKKPSGSSKSTKSNDEAKDKAVNRPAVVQKPPTKKQPEVVPVNVSDIFSSAPVKQSMRKDEKKSKDSKASSSTATELEHEQKGPTPKTSPQKDTHSKESPTKESGSKKDTHEKSSKKDTTEKTPKKDVSEKTPKKESTSSKSEKKVDIEPRQSLRSSPRKSVREPEPSSSKSSKYTKEVKSEIISTPKKNSSEFKTPTPVAVEKKSKTSKRPVPEDQSSDSDDNFDHRGKPPPSKKKRSGVPEMKTPTRQVEKEELITKAEKTPEQKSNFLKFISRNQTPRNLGSKDLPIGAEGCLAGLTFVITGVLDSLERDDAKDFITKYGGRVTGSISGKTSFVLIGDEAGESKLKKAAQLKVPQLSEDDLLEMVRKTNPNQIDDSMDVENTEVKNEEPEKKPELSPKKSKSKVQTPSVSPVKPVKVEKTNETSTTAKTNGKTVLPTPSSKPTSKTQSSTSAPKPSSQTQSSTPSLMWVDKYKPKSLKDVVGQSGDSSNAKKLLRWLQNWFNYHGSSTDKAKASWPGLRDPEGKTFKCALLSGPPGIGKTTTAHLVCQELGYDYFEMNASDTRNKRGLKENVADALSSNCITFGTKSKDELTRKHVLIMDEVDGMSGNEDRGGVQELIGLIKTSRVPIICICNDRNHPKIRSLANYCFDLKFNKPTFVQLKSAMMSICFKEKIKVASEKLQQLITSTDQDVRQIIHQLELFKESKSDAAYNPRKDLSFGPWDVVRKVFSAPDRVGMSIHDKTGLFFQDYSIGPLFVQENYPRYVPQGAKGDKFKHMDLLKKTAESIADGDLVDNIIRRSNNWSLLPVQAAFASYGPGEYMDGHCSSAPVFPMWLGKNSNKNKRSRLLQQLHTHMHLNVSGSLEALNMEYLPYLRRSIVNPLVNGDTEEAVQKMEDYTLLREDLDNINDLALWPGMRDPMERLDSKSKAAFTRQVNKDILPYSVVKAAKAKAKGSKDEEELEGLEEEEIEEEDEEEATVDKDAMVKMKTKPSSKKASSSSSKSKKRSKKDDPSDSEEETDRKSHKKAKSNSQASSSKAKAGSSKRK